MPDMTDRFEHLQILRELREELIAAAHRQEADRGRAGRVRRWLSRRVNAALVAVALVLAGGAIAAAATGVLIGRPVMWGLAADGAEGVQGVVEMLQTELARYMCMCGRPTLAAVDASVVRVHAPFAAVRTDHA